MLSTRRVGIRHWSLSSYTNQLLQQQEKQTDHSSRGHGFYPLLRTVPALFFSNFRVIRLQVRDTCLSKQWEGSLFSSIFERLSLVGLLLTIRQASHLERESDSRCTKCIIQICLLYWICKSHPSFMHLFRSFLLPPANCFICFPLESIDWLQSIPAASGLEQKLRLTIPFPDRSLILVPCNSGMRGTSDFLEKRNGSNKRSWGSERGLSYMREM